MPISEKEAVASFKLLVAMAKADGILHPDEQKTLEAAFKLVKLPEGTTLKRLFSEHQEVDELLKELESDEAKLQCYQAMFALANVDGDYAPEERQLMERVAQALKIAPEKVSFTQRIVSEAKDTLLPSNIKAVADPEKRAAAIKEDILKYAVLNAVFGANPLPLISLATDLASVGVQVKMVRDIGQYYGHTVDQAAAKSLLASVGLGTAARLAVSNLCKFVPGWGSFVGASSSFAATWALGRMAVTYFETGMAADDRKLAKEFKAAEKEGKKAYEASKTTIEEKAKLNQQKLAALQEDLKAGKLTQEQYAQALVEMG